MRVSVIVATYNQPDWLGLVLWGFEARVLFVGRLVAKKGVVHLLRAMARVQSLRPGTELFICGNGVLRASLETEARRRGVRATFLGVRAPTEVRDLMCDATVVCGPRVADSRGNNEGLGMVFIEAQACGTPVVVSTHGRGSACPRGAKLRPDATDGRTRGGLRRSAWTAPLAASRL